MKLDVAQLSEPHSANLALVRLLPSVDPQVSAVVGVDPEGLAALFALMGPLSRVLELVRLERLKDDEPLPAHLARERSLPCVGPQVVVVGCFVEERPAARLAVVLHPPRVNELVPFQQRGRVEAFPACPAAERRHVHRRLVLPVDDPPLPPFPAPPRRNPAASLVVSRHLVFLQLEVVQEGLAALVAHEGLGGAMEQHVGLQLGVLHEALAANLALKGLLPSVDAHVSLQVLLQGESSAARLTRERPASVHGLVRPERPPLGESLVAHGALVRMLPGVNAPMAVEREGIPETLPAFGAHVRLLHAVHGVVSPQVLPRLKALPTRGADKRS